MTSRGKTTRTTVAAATIIAAGALVAGCSSLSGGGKPSPTTGPPTPAGSASSSSAAPTTVVPPPPSPTTTSTQAEAGGTDAGGQCRTANLKVTIAHGTAGAGNHYVPIRFTNTGGAPCTLRGWPGVSYVKQPHGQPVGAPAQRVGQPQGTVRLQPGETASAALDRIQVHNYPPAKCDLTPVQGLRVYPPGNTASAFVPLDGAQACSSTAIPGAQLTIKATQSGSGGG